MGVKDLHKFLNNKVGNFETGPIRSLIDKFNIKVLVIDGSLYLHKFFHVTYSRDDAIHKFITFFSKLSMQILDTKLIFIFDGPNPLNIKADTIKNRRIQRDKIRSDLKKLDDEIRSETDDDDVDLININTTDPLSTCDMSTEILSKIEDYQKKVKQLHSPTMADVYHIAKLLMIDGYETYISDSDGDLLMAHFVKKNGNMRTAVLSDDGDFLPLGCRYVLKSVHKYIYKMYDLEYILRSLNLNMTQFITLCVFSGTDFSVRIPKVGIETIYKLLKKNGGLSVKMWGMCKGSIQTFQMFRAKVVDFNNPTLYVLNIKNQKQKKEERVDYTKLINQH